MIAFFFQYYQYLVEKNPHFKIEFERKQFIKWRKHHKKHNNEYDSLDNRERWNIKNCR